MIRIGVDIGGSHVGVGVIKNGNLIDMSGIDLSKQDKQNIKEAKSQIDGSHDPEIVIPVLFPIHACSSRSTREIVPAGHSFTHFPQPTQRTRST